MIDALVRPVINPPLRALAALLVKGDINAGAVTMTGFCLGLGAFAALALQLYPAALGFLLLNRLMDGLDGAVARASNSESDYGAYLDIVTDFIFYAGFVFFFALGRPEEAIAAAFVIFSYMGSGSAFLAYAVFAEKRGHITERNGKKKFFHIGGLAEGTETVLFMIAICAIPQHFPILALVFGLLCWATAAGRIFRAAKDFAPDSKI